MRYWKSRDEPTNSNLQLLDSIARSRADLAPERVLDKIATLRAIDKMLPQVVRRHFDLTSAYVGTSILNWSPEYLATWWADIAAAIEVGLDAVEADSSLQKGGDASFADRPPTRGEELKDACRAYSSSASDANLETLRVACSAPGLGNLFDRLTYWLSRKRPSRGKRPIRSEIWIAVSNIEARADHYHHQAASYRYAERRAARPAPESPDVPPCTPASLTREQNTRGLSLGQRVSHAKFGVGTIIDIVGQRIEVDFDEPGPKRVLGSFVTPAEA